MALLNFQKLQRKGIQRSFHVHWGHNQWRGNFGFPKFGSFFGQFSKHMQINLFKNHHAFRCMCCWIELWSCNCPKCRDGLTVCSPKGLNAADKPFHRLLHFTNKVVNIQDGLIHSHTPYGTGSFEGQWLVGLWEEPFESG